MNLEVFREQDTVWIRDTDTDDEWPLPAEVWVPLAFGIQEGTIMSRPPRRPVDLPSVWGQVSVEPTGASASDTPDGRG